MGRGNPVTCKSATGWPKGYKRYPSARHHYDDNGVLISERLFAEIYPQFSGPGGVPIIDPKIKYSEDHDCDYARVLPPGNRPFPCEICGELLWWRDMWEGYIYNGKNLWICELHSDFEVKVWRAARQA